MTDPLDRARWLQIDAVLDIALDLSPEERAAYLAEACGRDAELRREVEELLAASGAPASFLSTPAADRAAPLVAEIEHERARPSADPLIGRLVGPYGLVRKLGEGGMGFVYLAERADGQFQQQVAIKLAKQGLYGEEPRRRFLQERQILARLQHPAIARLLDGGVTEDAMPFIVMERVEGRVVTAYCHERALGIDDRLRILVQICDAVQYAHRNLIVHRDLKPSNILVDDAGRVKLLDFGIAKLLDEESASASQTIMRVLTPEYAAPEQLRGEPVSTSTDVYALGVLLFELLTGDRPYRVKGTAATEIEHAILEQEPRPPSTHVAARETRRRLRGDLDRIVLKAVQKAPERRYASAEAFAGDIRRHLEGLPVSAQGDALSYRARKFLGRHRLGVSAAALLGLTLVGGLIATTWQARRAEREARKAEAVKEFLKTLFSAGDPATAQGREPSVRELLDRGAARIQTDLTGQPDVQSEVARVMATVYQSLGEYDRIPSLLTEDLDRRRRLDGPRSIVVAELLTQIADARYEQSRFDEAATMYEEALGIQRERRGGRAPQVAELLWDLAGVARNRGDLARAEALQKDALALWVESSGDESAEATGARESLAITYGQAGRFAEAAALQQRVAAWRLAHYGADHPDTLNSRYNAAYSLHDLGRNTEAAEMLNDVIARQRRVLGARHDRLAVSLRVLARVLDASGRAEEARAPIEEALAIQSAQFGLRHFQVAMDKTWKAAVDADTGQLSEAETGAREALTFFDSMSGPAPATVPLHRTRAARVLAEAGRFDEAGAEMARAVADLRASRNEGAMLGFALDALADVALRQQQASKANELAREALTMLERALGRDHPDTALARVHAGAARWASGDSREGEASMRLGIAQLETLFPGGHQDLAAGWFALGQSLSNAHRAAEGRPFLQRALSWRETHYGAADPRAVATRRAFKSR